MLLITFSACNNNNTKQGDMYTCPMPSDSFFSNKPGICTKCGMELMKVESHVGHEDHIMTDSATVKTSGYTCPMHPQIHGDKAGTCPICGMVLELHKSEDEAGTVSLNTLLKPANQQVVANVAMVHLSDREENIEMESYGFVTYDTRQVGAISTNISGRIEKLYVKYRYQKVSKGQRIMDIYSPELMTAQQNLLFVVKNDPDNAMLIQAAKQKLLLLGMSNQQLAAVLQTRKPAFSVSLFSGYSGHIQESKAGGAMQNDQSPTMNSAALTTVELPMKEGMYIQKGQNLFSVYNPNRAWAVLNIFAGQAAKVKVGDKVRITPETNPDKDFRAAISYIEPVFRAGSKNLAARVYFDNSKLNIPIGSQVKATIFGGNRSASWLPEEAVLSLGLGKVVFVRKGESFEARKIETGIRNKHLVQVLSGLEHDEAVAANAQYLVDSESFIKTNEQ